MTYSSGMPILYFVGFLNFFIIYWAYKFLLIKHYRKTTSFNHRLPLFTINFFKIAVFLHLALGAYMYSNSKILSAKNLTYLSEFNDLLTGLSKNIERYTDMEEYVFFRRFDSGLSLLYFLFVLFLFVAWLF